MGVKISELNEATSAQNSDVLPIVQNEETKKISVETLGSQKVNKSGDTLTGDLDMQSNSVKFGNNGNILFKEDGYGDKFRIIPNFSGSGANNKLIIQSTTGEAGTDPQNWKDLVTIHADSGQVDLIHPTGWTDATKTSAIGGTVKYTKIGNIVIVNFYDVNIKQNITQHATVLATGLPKSTNVELALLTNFQTGAYLRISITDTGNIQNHWSNTNASNNEWYGTLIYITNE